MNNNGYKKDTKHKITQDIITLLLATCLFVYNFSADVMAKNSEESKGAEMTEMSEMTEITEDVLEAGEDDKEAAEDNIEAEETETDAETEETEETDPVDEFLAQSAFVGNSVGDGLTMYNNYKDKAPLGNAVMLTRGSYSFNNDKTSNTQYLPQLNGVPMRAKDAIKKSGARYAFICMGTNDLVGNSGAERAYENYQDYIAQIREENPDIIIFIESCTPSRPGSNVNNAKIMTFNSYMKDYCDENEDIYYIDIASPMSDEEGFLISGYASDGSVHLSNKAYSVWADTVRAYISDYIEARKQEIKEQNAIERAAALANYEESMRKMEDRKQDEFEKRLLARREAEQEEQERRRYELLNVPDEVTLMHKVIADRKEISDKGPSVNGLGRILQKDDNNDLK